jgi:hypothetical protein
MSTPESFPKKENVQVPRDAQVDPNIRSQNVPPDGRTTSDEDYAQDQRGLQEGSALADALHKNPPQGDDQLTTGSGGDSARPGKEGIFGKPIPPRGKM